MRFPPVSRLVLLVVALSGLCIAAAAQSPPAPAANSTQPAATLHIQAREVLLPVTVHDKHGALVTNLTADDFTLTEDNRLQTIKSFSVQSNLPFLLGLLVDTGRGQESAMDSERKAEEKFVGLMLPADAKDVKNGNQAFLIHFDREVELLEDFTNSRDKLDRELDEMGPTSERNNPQGPETSGDDRGGQERSRAGTQLYDAVYLASDELMKPKDGRKALIVFSDGVDRDSKETLNEALDAADHANLSIYTIYLHGETPREVSGFPGGHRGGGYPGGWPGGGYPGGGGNSPGGHRRDEETGVDGRKTMEEIATRTGGRYFEARRKGDLDPIYNLIAEELHGQYLLTYTPDQADNDGGYHKIVLKAKNPDLTVVTREGYYAPGGEK